MPIDKSRIKYFSVKWTALVSLIDGLDLDDLPDTDFITGVISFKPLSGGPLKFRSNTAGTEPFTLFPMTRRINISSGEFNEQSRKYIKLEAATNEHIPNAWNWQVIFDLAYNGTPIPLSPTSFMGAPDQIIDLTDYLPVKDLISGIEYARGPQGFSVFDITLSGAKDDLLTFVSDAPGTPVIRQITIPSMANAFDSAGIAVAASEVATQSKNTAVASKDTAVLSAADALASKNAAGASETNANTSKNAAAGSATAAAASEGTATSAKNAALASKTAAATSETNAATSEANALASKNAAGTSAVNAANSATASQTSRVASETARTGAEQARDAATSMVVPDQAVTRPKIKSPDITNILFGGGFEGGIESQDWTSNAYGANGVIATDLFWDGTRSFKVTNNGSITSVEVPTSPGEVFIFTCMSYVPVAVTGAGGLRMQWMDGAGVWTDIAASQSTNVESSQLAAATWTRCALVGVMPANARRCRVRVAHALTNYASGVYYDDMDWRRLQDTYMPGSILGSHIGTGQVAGTQLANGAVVAGKIVNGGVDTYARLAQSVSEQIAAQSLMFHDQWAFLTGITATMETTTDAGATWNSASLSTPPFSQRDGIGTTLAAAAVGSGVRYTLTGTTALSNATARFLVISFPYTAVAPSRTVILQSSPDGTVWTDRLNVTGQTHNAQTAVWAITDWSAHTRVRLTILNTTASQLVVGSIKMLVSRPGGEGRGSETAYPFAWDHNKTLQFVAGVQMTGIGHAASKVLVSDASGNATWQYILTPMITDAQITLAKMAANSVDSSKVVDASILGTDIAPETITSNNILNDTIVDADINSAAGISMTKLGTGRVRGFRNGTQTSTIIEVLTEAQYQALGTKDANTIYFRT